MENVSAQRRCVHFSIVVQVVYVAGKAMRLPAFHCAHCRERLEPLAEEMPLEFGPDGELVTREECTVRRLEQNCAPCLSAALESVSRAETTVQGRRDTRRQAQVAREEAAHMHAEAAALCDRVERTCRQSHSLCQQSAQFAEPRRDYPRLMVT